MIFISNLVFILFIVFFSYTFFDWFFFNLIPYNLIWFYFYINFGPHNLIFFSFWWFLFYFFNSTPHYLAHDFFEFDFYGSIQPHDPCHEFKTLNRVEFGLFLSAYSLFFFSISSFNIVLVEDLYSILFTFYFYVFILILYPES